MYYIISLSNTCKNHHYITLWRPKNGGYCFSKQMAGVYETLKEGYHDTEHNMAISIDMGDKLFITGKYDGEEIMPGYSYNIGSLLTDTEVSKMLESPKEYTDGIIYKMLTDYATANIGNK